MMPAQARHGGRARSVDGAALAFDNASASIAAAHAGCFAVIFALGQAGGEP